MPSKPLRASAPPRETSKGKATPYSPGPLWVPWFMRFVDYGTCPGWHIYAKDLVSTPIAVVGARDIRARNRKAIAREIVKLHNAEVAELDKPIAYKITPQGKAYLNALKGKEGK